LPPNSAVACFYAILDPSTGCFEFANAGDDAPLFRDGDGVAPLVTHVASKAASESVPLGVQLGTAYAPSQVTIDPGELILFHNRELPDIRNAQGEPFGSERLHELVKAAGLRGDQLIDAILLALDSFAGGFSKMQDSVVLLVLERKPANAAD
jgi:sigma-B regulation protein RsbU (phosphoserine phosphatase)